MMFARSNSFNSVSLKKKRPKPKRKRKSLPSGAVSINTLMLIENNTCHLCNKTVLKVDASRDHIIPYSKGGTWDISNIRLAHMRCNEARGDMELSLFMKNRTAILKKIKPPTLKQLRNKAKHLKRNEKAAKAKIARKLAKAKKHHDKINAERRAKKKAKAATIAKSQNKQNK